MWFVRFDLPVQSQRCLLLLDQFYPKILFQLQQIRVAQWWCERQFVVITVTVQKYDEETHRYCWKGCLVKITDAASGLLSIYTHFWQNRENFQVHTTSRESSLVLMIVTVWIYNKEICSYHWNGVRSIWRMLWVDWHDFSTKVNNFNSKSRRRWELLITPLLIKHSFSLEIYNIRKVGPKIRRTTSTERSEE